MSDDQFNSSLKVDSTKPLTKCCLDQGFSWTINFKVDILKKEFKAEASSCKNCPRKTKEIANETSKFS